jgi:two-component system chemotaxis sensor kinase CheA
MLGRQQTVVKSLGRLLQGVRGVSGASILGNGEVALILQATELADMASQAHIQPSIQTAPDPTP